MMIAPSQGDHAEQQTATDADADEKRVLSKEEATTLPQGRTGHTHGFGAAKGKCDLGTGAERW